VSQIPAFFLEPQYRDYVWGGRRLRPGQLTAEIWAVHEDNRITSGPLAGMTLGQAAGEQGEALLGQYGVPHEHAGGISSEDTGRSASFPLLIKLLDCAEWLSLQVHPNDEQAVEIEGPGKNGKTEAWYILDAQPGAEILCGFQDDADPSAALRSVQDGSILDYTRRVPMRSGDTVFIRAGTLHALGPGLLVYEVQQTSDITYRVFDWNRPAADNRPLHIQQSLAVLDVTASADPRPTPTLAAGEQQRLLANRYFVLDLLASGDRPIHADPAGLSFHALTAIEGGAELRGEGWSMPLTRYQTALVPAGAGAYTIRGQARLLRASIERKPHHT
jgi:mannose-6-phosphate isomerase